MIREYARNWGVGLATNTRLVTSMDRRRKLCPCGRRWLMSSVRSASGTPGDADAPFIQFFTSGGERSPSVFVRPVFERILFLMRPLGLGCRFGRMVVKAKVAGAPRRVWRMTAENQLGEILELAPAPGLSDRGGRSQDARASAGASVASLSSPSSPTSSASNGAASPCMPRAVTLDPAPVSSWRASSYDLLHGLRVHDVTDKIPPRMFAALFSPDPGARAPSTRKRS